MFGKNLKDKRYHLERPRNKHSSYRKNNPFTARGRLDEQDNIPEDRFNVRRNRIKQLTETYSADTNILIDDSFELDYSADYSEMSSKESKGKKKKGKKSNKSKHEQHLSPELYQQQSKTGKHEQHLSPELYQQQSKTGKHEQHLSPELYQQQSKTGKHEQHLSPELYQKQGKTGQDSPKPMEPIYELNKRSSGSVKNIPENHHKSESLVGVSRTVIRSKPSVHKGAGIFSPSNLLQNLVKSRHPSTQISPVLKANASCDVPGDLGNIERIASNSGYPTGSAHSFGNLSKIPTSRTAMNYFQNETSTQTDGYLLTDSPNYMTATSRKPSKLTAVHDSYDSANQKGTGPRPLYLDNDSDPEKFNRIGFVPAPNRDIQAKKFPNAKNTYICYKISVPSAGNPFTESAVHKQTQVPQTNIIFDQASKTYASHAFPPRETQSCYDGGKKQYEAPNTVNMYAEDVSSSEMRDFNCEKKKFRRTSVSNSETNAAKMQPFEYGQRSKVDIGEGPRKSVGPIRENPSDRNKYSSLKDGITQYDTKSSMYEVGASKSYDSVKSLKDWNIMVARDFEHLLALYQNFKSMTAKWECTDEGNHVEMVGNHVEMVGNHVEMVGNHVEMVGKENNYREDCHNFDMNETFYMDILDDPDNKVNGQDNKSTILIATDDECQTTVNTKTTVNTEDGHKPEYKLTKGIHNSVEYLKLYRICCAAKAASEADIKTPGIDNKGYVEDGFVDYLQRHREFDVRKLINMCGIQLVSVDEDILANLHNYLQLYSDYQTEKNGGTAESKEAKQYAYIEDTFNSYVQLYYVFSAAKLLSEEGQEIPGVDKNGFLDDDFLDYLQQFRYFSVRKVINDCSFSTPSAFIANNVGHYIQEYLRLYDEYQAHAKAIHNQIPDPITHRQSVCGHKDPTTQRQSTHGHQNPATQQKSVYAHHDPRYVYPAKVPEVAAQRNGYQRGLNKGNYQPMQNCALLRNACDLPVYKDICCSSCQVEDFDLYVLDEANRTSQRNVQEEKNWRRVNL